MRRIGFPGWARCLLLCISLVLWLPACGGASIRTADFEGGVHTVLMEGNRVERDWFSPLGGLDLNVQKVFKTDDDATYLIVVVSRFLARPVDILGGPSLAFLVDGRRLTLRAEASRQKWLNYDGTISEIANYKIAKEDLLALASAVEVRYRLSGQQRSLAGEFAAQNIHNIKRFVDQHVPRTRGEMESEEPAKGP